MSLNDRMPGVAVAVVTDRDNNGQVRLTYPWLDESLRSDWVPVAAPMAGGGRGLFMMPETGDEVVVAFQHGDLDHPIVLGFMWNGADKPPAADPRERTIRSKNGHSIRFVDSTPTNGDMGALIVEDAHGNRVTLSNGKIALHSTALLEINGAIVTINGRVVQPGPNPI
jgi:phage baseplate assembly protein V